MLKNDGSGLGVIFSHPLVSEMEGLEKQCTWYADICTALRQVTVDLPGVANIPQRKTAASKLLSSNRQNKWGKGIIEAVNAIAMAEVRLAKPSPAKEKPTRSTTKPEQTEGACELDEQGAGVMFLAL